MVYLWITLFVLCLIAFCSANLFGLPGNWLIVVGAAAWFWLGPGENPFAYQWHILIVLLLLAIVGEVVEFAASVAGTRKLGGSKTGATASVVGSILGGILGAFVALPIPVLGWIIGSILFACLGAFLGAAIAEKWLGKPIKSSLKIGGAAGVGRLLGTAGKLIFGTIMTLISVLALFI